MSDCILVIEDDTALRHVLRELLRTMKQGYMIEEAADGLEGIEKLRAGAFDLVLSDIVMPNLDGIGFLQAARSEFKDIPVIMVTAVQDERRVLDCLRQGAWDYIMKPFDVQQVRAAVKRALAVGGNPGPFTEDIAISSGPGWLELMATSEVEYLHRFRKFTEVLLGARLSPSDREDVRMAIEEIGRNAIEWGNRFDTEKRIRLSYCRFEDKIVFKIEDEGNGFNPALIEDPSLDPVAHLRHRQDEGKRPGGYGIHIVRKIMDEITYSDRGNVVVMTKRLG